MTPRSLLVCIAVCGVSIMGTLGCPKRTATKQAPAPCTQFGQQCELEPGKLGACATKSNCTTGNCLYCQSQH